MAEKKQHPDGPDADTGHAIGPTSIQGLEASELDNVTPDGERGSVDTDPRRIAARKLPAQTGETQPGNGAPTPGPADAKHRGPRKRN